MIHSWWQWSVESPNTPAPRRLGAPAKKSSADRQLHQGSPWLLSYPMRGHWLLVINPGRETDLAIPRLPNLPTHFHAVTRCSHDGARVRHAVLWVMIQRRQHGSIKPRWDSRSRSRATRPRFLSSPNSTNRPRPSPLPCQGSGAAPQHIGFTISLGSWQRWAELADAKTNARRDGSTGWREQPRPEAGSL